MNIKPSPKIGLYQLFGPFHSSVYSKVFVAVPEGRLPDAIEILSITHCYQFKIAILFIQ